MAAAGERLLARLSPGPPGPRWPLPPDARWGELTFRLTADEAIACTFRGQTRQLDPDFFGMRSARNRKPTASWTALKALAIERGVVPIADPKQVGRIQKRYQLLGKELRAAFGIREAPIAWHSGDRCYRAAFVISDERPERARRSFAGPRRAA